MKYNTILLLSLFVISFLGCDKKDNAPLTENEKKEISESMENLRMIVAEGSRVKSIATDYLSNYLEIKVNITENNAFDDRKRRPCFSGTIFNKGDEIIRRVHIVILFYDESANLIKKWETNFFNGLGSSFEDNPRTRAALIVLGTETELIGPAEIREVKSYCMKEPFLGWSTEGIKYEINTIELEPKI